MKKQRCKKRPQTRSSSKCTHKKKKAKTQNCSKISAGPKKNLSKSQLPVTCGSKDGILYLKSFYKKQKCISSEGQWFSPSEFERFGMKERNKKWKTSILCYGIPLLKLMQDGFLSYGNFKKTMFRRVQKKKRHTGSQQQKSDKKTNDNQDDDIDITMFKGPTLPVTCGSDSGTLHKHRFTRGQCGRCIRTENSWLTPEDFIRLNKLDGMWKKDILSNGIPLGKLITKKVLEPHAINCNCESCQVLDQNQQNDDECFVCDSVGHLVCCDDCPRSFHSDCHLPALDEDSLGEHWSCTFCVMKTKGLSQKTQQDVLSSPVSQFTQHCQCLLFHLLLESKTDTVKYSEKICGPMMLGRVKQNLENDDYQTVKEFVSDIEYVFHHCTSNRDNDFSRMTSRLKDLFETIFKPL